MRFTIFFDDGGVLNNNRKRAPQWRNMVAEFLVPKYGKTYQQWSEANAFTLLKELDAYKHIDLQSDFATYWQTTQIKWINNMMHFVGLPLLADTVAVELATAIRAYVTPKVRATFPHVIPTIKTLCEHYRLATASAETSDVLNGYLNGMGVRTCFTHLFGPDLVNAFKPTKSYYESIFEQTDTPPSYAIFIDDASAPLYIVEQLGAHVIQACLDNQKPLFPYFFTDFSQLPKIIETITSK